MITEEEARKKWCPFARTVEKLVDGISFPRNRVVNVPNKDDLTDVEFLGVLIGTTCIASDCIHWVEIVDGYGYPGCSPFWARMAAKYYQDNEAGKP